MPRQLLAEPHPPQILPLPRRHVPTPRHAPLHVPYAVRGRQRHHRAGVHVRSLPAASRARGTNRVPPPALLRRLVHERLTRDASQDVRRAHPPRELLGVVLAPVPLAHHLHPAPVRGVRLGAIPEREDVGETEHPPGGSRLDETLRVQRSLERTAAEEAGVGFHPRAHEHHVALVPLGVEDGPPLAGDDGDVWPRRKRLLQRRFHRLGHARADLVLVRDELDGDARVRGAELGGELDARGTRADDHDALGARDARRELSQFLDAIFSAHAGVVGLEPLGLAALGVGGAGADDEDVVLVFLAAHRGLHVRLRHPRHGVVDVRHHARRVLAPLEDLVERDDVAVGGLGPGDGPWGRPRDVQVVVGADHGDLNVVGLLRQLLAHVHRRETTADDHHPLRLPSVHPPSPVA